MPKSKASRVRKGKLKKRHAKQEKWVARKVASFNALPEEAKQSLLQRWSFGKQKEEPGQPGAQLVSPQVVNPQPPEVDDHWKHHESGG